MSFQASNTDWAKINSSNADSNITESQNSEKTSGTKFQPALISGLSRNYIHDKYNFINKTISVIVIVAVVFALIIAVRKTIFESLYKLLR